VTDRPEGEEYDVEAILRYNPAEVQVAGQPDYEERFQGRGRAVLVRAQAPAFPGEGARSSGTFGLTLTDAGGKPFTLTPESSRRAFDRTGSEVTDVVKLSARPTEPGQGSPAKLSFSGTRAKVVEVPFKFTDVPVAVGTAELPDEPKTPAGR
jgi:hypothetical protein